MRLREGNCNVDPVLYLSKLYMLHNGVCRALGVQLPVASSCSTSVTAQSCWLLTTVGSSYYEQALPPDDQVVACLLFGWNMVDLNFTTGALLGYSSLNSKVKLKVPAQRSSRIGLLTTSGLHGPRRSTTCRLRPTSVPWGVLRAKDDGIPHHDVIRIGRSIDTLRWIIFEALEISHQALQ